jgi:hypothetical protein
LLEKSDTGEAIVLSVIRSLCTEEAFAQQRKIGEKPMVVQISQKKLIEEVQKKIPKLTSRGIMRMFRVTFGFTAEPIKMSYDYLHRIETDKLDGLLVSWGLKEKEQTPNIKIPDTPGELIKQH